MLCWNSRQILQLNLLDNRDSYWPSLNRCTPHSCVNARDNVVRVDTTAISGRKLVFSQKGHGSLKWTPNLENNYNRLARWHLRLTELELNVVCWVGTKYQGPNVSYHMLVNGADSTLPKNIYQPQWLLGLDIPNAMYHSSIQYQRQTSLSLRTAVNSKQDSIYGTTFRLINALKYSQQSSL